MRNADRQKSPSANAGMSIAARALAGTGGPSKVSMTRIAVSGTKKTATMSKTDRRQARNACCSGSVMCAALAASARRSATRTSFGLIARRNARFSETRKKLPVSDWTSCDCGSGRS